MKRQDFNQRVDQTWAWPRKTWLQQRLETVKAEKQGERQKGGGTAAKPAAFQAKAVKSDSE